MTYKYPNNIQLGHGGGGRLTGRLIRDAILPRLDRGHLSALPDAAVLNNITSPMAFTTDSFVVSPIFFPGGDIGSLAVHGTCNDLACAGAKPEFLSLGLILEEGLSIEELDKVLNSIARASDNAGVEVVTGDTKVVPKGSADRIFINTSGIGLVKAQSPVSIGRIANGDRILVSGSVGNHGLAVMLSRAEFSFGFNLESDSASIWPLVERLLELGPSLKFLRDPTRGGLAATLNEMATGSGLGIYIDESAIPLDQGVVSASEILGIDPLQSANEGKVVVVVEANKAQEALELMATSALGKHASIIGEFTTDRPGAVVMNTKIGGQRIIPEPSGELLPRIC